MMMANEGLFGLLTKRCFKKILVVTIASCEREFQTIYPP